MQDHDRATILGEPSFGKGLVQSVYPLTENTGLALTTALYYTPSGRSIQKPLDAARFDLGATTAHPNKQSRIPHRQGPAGDRRRRHSARHRGVSADRPIACATCSTPAASFTNFATEYLRTHKIDAISKSLRQMLDEFRSFSRSARSGPASRMAGGARFISNRLKTELFNQAFGVEKGDEVEASATP